jgi:aminomethyltransferase
MIPSAMEPHGQPRKTPLTSAHQRLGAKLIDFGGWLMPVNYPDGIIEEHKATRSAVGVFDVCHMGEIHFRGPRAAEAVQRLVTNNVGGMSDGRAMYAVTCHPSGGIVDDLIVYRVTGDHFLLVVNASNIDKDHQHFVKNAGALCQIDDQSDSTALIAFQGPKAAAALAGLTNADLASLRSFCFLPDRQVAGRPAWIARTGYTGEDGFELFCRPGDARALAIALLDAGRPAGLELAGLGARDSLRLEAGYPLYGHEISATISPLQAGLGWVVKLDKAANFVGRDALCAQKAAGFAKRIVFFKTGDRRIVRAGTPVVDSSGPVGEVVSGTLSPVLNESIGSALVRTGAGELSVDVRGTALKLTPVKPPFVPLAPKP